MQELLHRRKTLLAQQKEGVKHQQRQISQALRKVESDLSKLGKSHEIPDRHRSTSRLGRGQMVDYRFFLLQMWPKISGRRRSSPSAVWTEIMSFIRGGTKGELSEEEYLALPRKDSPLFREFAEEGDALSRKAVYKMYVEYKNILKELQAWDCSELVTHLCKQIKQHQWRGPRIKSVLVDEVQDFSMAECELCMLLSDKNALVMAGDTCQTISRSAFRFESLRALFFAKREQELKQRVPEQMLTVVPDVSQLSTNYRSHAGILGAANLVVKTIERLFPGSIDVLDEELGAFDGTKPLLLPDKDLHSLSKFVHARMGADKNAPISFGSNQAVIVRTSASKAQLPAEFRESLVLTVEESKGLEFNDVLLFNFFADSDAELSEWMAVLDDTARENPVWFPGHMPAPCTDVAEMMALNEDLKHLYVALTRARRRVIIFDNGVNNKRSAVFELLDSKDLAVTATVEDLALSSAEDNWMDAATQSHQWTARGDELMQVGTLGGFEEAAKCYRRGGHQPGELRAMAQIFQLQVCVSGILASIAPLFTLCGPLDSTLGERVSPWRWTRRRGGGKDTPRAV